MKVRKYTVRVILIIMMLAGWGVSAQFSSDEDRPEGNEIFDFMVGEWSVESERWLQAYDTKEPEEIAEWHTSTGVARIESHVADTGLLEYYVSVVDDLVYEQTVFMGTRNNGLRWYIASTDNRVNELFSLRADMADDEFLATEISGFMSEARRQIEIEPINEDAYIWRMWLEMPDDSRVLVWTKSYTRLEDPQYETTLEAFRAEYESPPPLEEMSDFHFWLGYWQVEHPRLDDVVDRIALSNGGHTMIEFWEARGVEPQSAFFTMTIWDAQEEHYHNWLFGAQGGQQEYTGGTCEGEGAEKECRLAGVFYNITEDRIDWRFNRQEWVFHRIEAP